MNNELKYITVGEIVNTQGHRGEVRVWPLTDFPERFSEKDVLIMEKKGRLRQLTIERVRFHKNFIIIKFAEITDMNEAEELKGGLLKIRPDQLMELPPDSYYVFDIIGMAVETDEGLVLGRIKDIIQTGSNDVYVVEGQDKDYLIPATREVVREIDKISGKITVKPLEGLLDL